MKYFYCIFAAVTTVAMIPDPSNPIKLKVSVYYESYSSDCKDFITNQLHPIFCKIKDYLNLELVPFGVASSCNKWFICQNGPKECIGNTIHNCVLKRIHDSVAQLEYVNCAMSNYDLPGQLEKTCVEDSSLSVEEINTCSSCDEGYQLMLYAQASTDLVPEIQYVPIIVFDNKYSDTNQKNAILNFENTICEMLTTIGYTKVCSNGKINSSKIC